MNKKKNSKNESWTGGGNDEQWTKKNDWTKNRTIAKNWKRRSKISFYFFLSIILYRYVSFVHHGQHHITWETKRKTKKNHKNAIRKYLLMRLMVFIWLRAKSICSMKFRSEYVRKMENENWSAYQIPRKYFNFDISSY